MAAVFSLHPGTGTGAARGRPAASRLRPTMRAAAFRLPPVLTICTVGKTRHALTTWIATLDRRATVWPLDAAGVAEADAAGVELLLSISRSATLAGARLCLDAPSRALCQASAQSGIAPIVLGTLDQEVAA